jgi:hypothetical protein
MKLFTVAVDGRPVVVISAIGDDVQEVIDALDSSLGDDLRALRWWDGDLRRLAIRPARQGEEWRWQTSRQLAIRQGQHAQTDMRWLYFLVPMPPRGDRP